MTGDFHLDTLAGHLTGWLDLISLPVANTLPALSAYEGSSIDRLFPAPETAPSVRVTRRWSTPLVVSEDITFRSPHEPIEPAFAQRHREQYPENHTVYARRIRPIGAGHRPRLIYYHGYMQPETPLEEVALLVPMALYLGIEIVQIQPPYHGRRTPGASWYSGQLYWTADLVRSVESLRQSVMDARALLSWLLEEDDRPTGVSGLSLGGALSQLLTCLEPRLAFSAPWIAHMDLGAMVADVPVLERMRRDLSSFGWRPEDVGDFFRRLGFADLGPKIPPERIVLLAARDDRFFDAAIVEELWRRWGEPQIHWFPSSHLGFLRHLPEAVGLLRPLVERVG